MCLVSVQAYVGFANKRPNQVKSNRHCAITTMLLQVAIALGVLATARTLVTEFSVVRDKGSSDEQTSAARASSRLEAYILIIVNYLRLAHLSSFAPTGTIPEAQERGTQERRRSCMEAPANLRQPPRTDGRRFRTTPQPRRVCPTKRRRRRFYPGTNQVRVLPSPCRLIHA